MYQVNVYLETSIKGVKKTIGWYGYLLEWIDSKGKLHTLHDFRYETGVTPNMLILIALCAALNRMTKESEITVYTDNQYLRSGYIKYLPGWKENGWKTARGEQIKNLQLWQQVVEKTARHAITFNAEYHHGYKNWMASELQKRRLGNV